MNELDANAKGIFLEAVEQQTPDKLDSFLDAACGGNPALRARVEALLEAHREAGDFLACTSPDQTGMGGPATEHAGAVIGPYQLVEQIGEGGFGVVFRADQQRPVRRGVALKVLKPGMDTRQVVARFEAERQALALMDHPNIAHVLDGGETASGRPYFVMDLVQGGPITQYCDDHQLTLRERLVLFVAVCQAVQHAHQKGIIHRDLKPSNILVAAYDGKPVPKVIDFGIAKALGQRLTDETLVTGLGRILGTLEYMSPEQAELNALDIDTRADIYSLGVLLYELLTGTTPLTRAQLRQTPVTEALRLIREEEAPNPSTRLSTSTESLASIAARRKLEPARLTREVRGELDWIVMKCLEKDRDRRYTSPRELADDLERYLRGEAVLARPSSARYRLTKFVWRHRAAVLAVGAVAAALLIGAGVAVWQAVVATRAKGAALAAAAAETEAKGAAQAKEAEAQAVLDFVLTRVFAAARPEGEDGGLGQAVTLRQALEAALPVVDRSFANQPLVEARVRATLGDSFSYLGDPRIAADQFGRARTLFTECLGPDHRDTLRSTAKLAGAYVDLGRNAEAVPLFEEALAAQTATLGPDHRDTLTTRTYLGLSYFGLGRYADALRVHEEVLAVRRAKLGRDHVDTIYSMNCVAMCYLGLGRMADAAKLYEETLALMKVRRGPNHRDTLTGMQNLAACYVRLGDYAAGEKLLTEVLPALKTKLGPGHPHTLICMTNLAVCRRHLGDYAAAEKLLGETLALQKVKPGPDHPDTLRTMTNLADCYAHLDRHGDAIKLLEETLALQKVKLAPGHAETLMSMNNLAASYSAVGRHAEALKLLEETLALRKASLGPDHRETLFSMWRLAGGLSQLGRGADAVPILDDCLRRAAGKEVDLDLIPAVMDLRLRHFENAKDAAGCRTTAELWEQLRLTDPASLYAAACYRAVTATVLRAAVKSSDAAGQADADADRAMAWLKQAVAAGFKDAARLTQDKDLAALRDRPDFRELLARLQAGR